MVDSANPKDKATATLTLVIDRLRNLHKESPPVPTLSAGGLF